jgi:hypothetical protein
MKMDSKGIPRRRNRKLPEHPTDLSAAIASMEHNVGQHFFSGHVTVVSVGKDKWYGLG